MKESQQPLESTATITLLDGRTLPLYLKSEQPSQIVADTLTLDTTGQYLTVGRKKLQTPEDSNDAELERQYGHHLFTENVWFLLDHAEEIFNDSRMFLAPVRVQNGMAYTGTSGFRRPTIGVYFEWWLNFRDKAIDAKGNPIWYISGSPLSGRNCCMAVTPEGKQVKMDQRTSFGGIARSFMDVNKRYDEAKQIAQAYTLEEVLIKLRGEDYRTRLITLKHELKYKRLQRLYNGLESRFDALTTLFAKRNRINKMIQMEANTEVILQFAKQYFEAEELYHSSHKVFVKKRNKLKEQLHAGTLNGDYRALLNNVANESRARRHELVVMGQIFLEANFGKNPNGISLKDVLNFAKQKLKEQ